MDFSQYEANYTPDADVLKQLYASSQHPQPQPQVHHGNFLTHLLPTIGSIGGALLGSFGGPAGTIAAGGGGGALGKLLENKLEGTSAGHDVLREGIKGGIFSAIPVAGEAAGSAVPGLQELPVLGKGLFGGAKAAQAAVGAGNAVDATAADAATQAFDKFGTGRELSQALEKTPLSNRLGTGLRNDARNISDIVTGPKAGYTAAEVGDFADRNNLYGSAENQWLKQLPKLSDKLDTKVTSAIANNTKTIDAQAVKDAFSANLQKLPDYLGSQGRLSDQDLLSNVHLYDKVASQNAIKNPYEGVEAKVYGIIDKAAQDGKLDSNALHELAKDLSSHANFNPNADPNIGKDTYKAAWQAVREHLTNLNPEASQAIHDQSLAIQVSKAFEDASGSGGRARLGMKGVRIPVNVGRPVTAIEDALGRGFQNIGGNPATSRPIDQILGGFAGQARAQAPGRIAAAVGGSQVGSPTPPPNPQDAQLAATAPPTDFSSPSAAIAPPPPATINGYTADQLEQGMQKAMLAGDFKAAQKLDTLAKALTAQEKANQPQLDSSGISKVTDFQNASDALTNLTKAFPQNGNPANEVLDKKILGVGIPGGGSARDLSAQIQTTNEQIAKALGVGTSKQAQATLGLALPSVTDNQATAQRKVAEIMSALRARLENYLSLQQQYSPKNASADTSILSSLTATGP